MRENKENYPLLAKINDALDRYQGDLAVRGSISEHDYNVMTKAIYGCKKILAHILMPERLDKRFISIDYLMDIHPQLSIEEAASLLNYCFDGTIKLRECYGDGSIMFPKWRESINQNNDICQTK